MVEFYKFLDIFGVLYFNFESMYKCQKCGYTSAIKLGKCPNCWEFGSFVQDEQATKPTKSKKKKLAKWAVLEFNKASIKDLYFSLWEKEILRILPQGIKKWGVYLLWWEPGIGKSTIVLQLLDDLLAKKPDLKIGYFSWEEHQAQIAERLKRLNLKNIKLGQNLNVYYSSVLEDVLTTAQMQGFDLIIFDSIQTIYSNQVDSPAWSVSQVKLVAEKISEFAKSKGVTSFVIGHITKWGEIAWPKYLEHIVDVVLYLEGDRFGQYRFLRAKKNRFGPADEVGIFEMTLFGLQPVYDMKQRILEWVKTSVPGSVLTVGIDNGRPVLVSLEVLLNKTNYKYPKRVAIGIDSSRLDLVVAILERYLNIKLGYFDIFVNIPGEFRFYDSWLDLAIAAAIYGQYKNKILPSDTVRIGEIGLGWQVLPTKLHQKRKKEAEGFNVVDFETLKNIVELPGIV